MFYLDVRAEGCPAWHKLRKTNDVAPSGDGRPQGRRVLRHWGLWGLWGLSGLWGLWQCDSVPVCRAIFGQAGLKISCDLTGWSLMQPDIITRPSHLRPGYQATIFQILVFIFNENLHSHGNCTQYMGSVQVESWITEYIIKMPSRHISLESSSIACVSPARTFLNILPASSSSFYFYSGGKLKQN